MRLIEYLFPTQCIICSKVGEFLCPKCIKGIPHTLPICCVCNKLSNRHLTHLKCSNLNITYFTGWYLSNEISKVLQQKIQKGIWDIHLKLLSTLISNLKIENLINECRIFPLPSKDINKFKLNKSLSKEIKGKRKSKNILFIGNRLENIKEIEEVIRGLPFNPLNIYILCIFVTIQ